MTPLHIPLILFWLPVAVVLVAGATVLVLHAVRMIRTERNRKCSPPKFS